MDRFAFALLVTSFGASLLLGLGLGSSSYAFASSSTDMSTGRSRAASATSTAALLKHPKATVGSDISLRIKDFLTAHNARRESVQEPDVVRTAPIAPTTNTTTDIRTSPSTASFQTLAPQGTSSIQNLISNPSFEQIGTGGIPVGWKKGGYGDNTRSLYLIAGAHSGSYAARVYISSYHSGDAKWYFTPLPVDGGGTYIFSDWYFANVPTEVDAQVTHTDGSISYVVLGKALATTYGNYTQFSSTFTLPQDASKLTIFHIIYSAGSLTVDDYSLQEQATTSGDNYVPNGSLEISGSNGNPSDWIKGGYGSNTRTFTYPIAGESGSAAKVSITNYQDGDAKWAPELVALPQGSYAYTDRYQADIPSTLTAQFQRQDGSFYYSNLKTLASASVWTSATAFFTMPSDAVAMRIFHLIKGNGTLSVDSVAITDASNAGSGIFKTGAVTFRFDDGLESQYTAAAPILKSAGFPGTFYIVSQQIADNDFSGYVSIADVQDLYSKGNEIGAHTRTHPHLTTLSAADQKDEIAGSRQDILSWNVGPVLSFSYPYGEYDSTTTKIVQDSGFQSAVSTISGYVTPNSDHYQLEYQELHNDTTLAQVQKWVDTAVQTHTWLILTFHDIKNNGDLYSTSPSMFQDIVNYVKQGTLPVVTVSQGMQSM